MATNQNQHQFPPPNIYDMHTRVSLLEQSQKTTEAQLRSINANTGKLVWIVLTAVVLGVLNSLLRVA